MVYYNWLPVWSYDSHTILPNSEIGQLPYNVQLPASNPDISVIRVQIHINDINIHDISFKTDNKRVAKKLLALVILIIHDVWTCSEWMLLWIEQNWTWSNKTFPCTLCVVSTSDETIHCGICLTSQKNLHWASGGGSLDQILHFLGQFSPWKLELC